MLNMLRKMGIRSSHMYAAGTASILASFASWMLSRQYENEGIARADRWGIFIGEWAPTFMALGVGLAVEEMREQLNLVGIQEEEIPEQMRQPAGV
ncbi:hypothetical protein ACFQYP_48915 [Nonomuraea antimicrobica]